MDWQFGPPDETEYALIFDSWARAFQKSPWAGCVLNHKWDEVSRAGISEVLDRGALVLVAYVPLEDGTRRVAGYVVAEPDRKILHWVYVKRDYRIAGFQLGTALVRLLVREPKWTYTYRTLASAPFLRRALGKLAPVHEPVGARIKL